MQAIFKLILKWVKPKISNSTPSKNPLTLFPIPFPPPPPNAKTAKKITFPKNSNHPPLCYVKTVISSERKKYTKRTIETVWRYFKCLWV